jgi:hypothetical protein
LGGIPVSDQDGHSHSDPLRDRDTYAVGLGNAKSVGNAVEHAHRIEYADGVFHADADANAEQYGYGNPDGYVEQHADGVQYRDREQHVDGDRYFNRYVTGNSNLHPDLVSDAHANPHGNANRRLRGRRHRSGGRFAEYADWPGNRVLGDPNIGDWRSTAGNRNRNVFRGILLDSHQHWKRLGLGGIAIRDEGRGRNCNAHVDAVANSEPIAHSDDYPDIRAEQYTDDYAYPGGEQHADRLHNPDRRVRQRRHCARH